MNVNHRFMNSNEIMEFLGGGEENTLEELNLRLNLPRQEPTELVYNSCCEILPQLQNIILPELNRLEHGRSGDSLLVNSDNLWNCSRWVALALPNGAPCEFVCDAARCTTRLKTIEPLNTDAPRFWCYVERTIFFHLDRPHASLDVVMAAFRPPVSVVGNQAEGPPDGLTFAATASGTARTITCREDAEDESIFQERCT
jgi:hypothetical protein